MKPRRRVRADLRDFDQAERIVARTQACADLAPAPDPTLSAACDLQYRATTVVAAEEIVRSVLNATGPTLTPSARTALADAAASLAYAARRIDQQRKRLLRKSARKESKR